MSTVDCIQNNPMFFQENKCDSGILVKRDRLPHGSKNEFCMILAKHGPYEKVLDWQSLSYTLNGCSGPIGAGRSGGSLSTQPKKISSVHIWTRRSTKHIKTRQHLKNITTPYRQGKPCAFLIFFAPRTSTGSHLCAEPCGPEVHAGPGFQGW